MSDKILVIGATGNLGPPLVQQLVEKGAKVKAATRNPDSYEAQPGVEATAFDFDRPETYRSALKGANRVVLILGGLDVTPDRTAIPFIDQAKELGIAHIVFISGMSVDKTDTPWFPRIENHLMASGIAFTILRPGWFMPLFIQGFVSPDKICLPLGDAKISFIHPRDISAVAAATVTDERHRGQIYTLSGSRALSMKEGTEIISKIVGVHLQYVAISDDEIRTEYQQRGSFSTAEIEYIIMSYRAGRDGLYSIVSNDVAEVLGRPPITLEQFAEQKAHVWQTDKG